MKHFSIEVGLVAEMTVINPFDFFLEDYAEKFPFRYAGSQAKELAPYVTPEPAGAQLRPFLESIDLTPRRTMDFLVELNQRVQQLVRYVIRMEPGVQTCEETLTLGTGSCRDSAWLLVQILRHLGLAARFVSGYLIQLKADVKALDGPEGPGADFTDLHAWAEVYLARRGLGGPGSDVRSVGRGGSYSAGRDAGARLGCAGERGRWVSAKSSSFTKCRLRGYMKIRGSRCRIRTSSGSASRRWAIAWMRRFGSSDIRLTMGGEPTLISIDNMDGEEWNYAATGPEKRMLAGRLLERLRARFAPGALLHFGTGKWYPGEPLPRWALTCCWRKDGIAMWHDRKLQANEEDESHFGPPDAQRFVETLALRLGLDPQYSNPAYEDPFYYQHRERQLPLNVDPLANHLEDETESARLRQVFERGLERPAGFVYPLQRKEGKNGPEWQSGLWMLRGQHLYLVPGDSPVGLRLPLPSLPWAEPEELPKDIPVDPMASRDELPSPARIPPPDPVLQRVDGRERERDRRPAVGESASWVVRTALIFSDG